jgi:hypothetical protein
MKHIWNQIKYFVKNEILDRPWRTGFLINAVVTISIWTAHCEYEKLSIKHINILENANRSLMNEQLDLLETNKLLGAEYERLVDENQIFSSMLAEIENEPGGHKMLKKLYKQTNQ